MRIFQNQGIHASGQSYGPTLPAPCLVISKAIFFNPSQVQSRSRPKLNTFNQMSAKSALEANRKITYGGVNGQQRRTVLTVIASIQIQSRSLHANLHHSHIRIRQTRRLTGGRVCYGFADRDQFFGCIWYVREHSCRII